MHQSASAIFLCAALALPAYAEDSRNVATEAMNLAVSITSTQLNFCADNYPVDAKLFNESMSSAKAKLGIALEELRPVRAQDLSAEVPRSWAAGKAMMAALMSETKSKQTLEECQKTAREMADLTGTQAKQLMNQLVTTILSRK